MRATIFLVLVCIGGAARADERAAITGGAPDDGDAAVVALLVAGELHCSGTLIARRVVLTAAHCLVPLAPTSVYFGATPPAGGAIVGVSATAAHPRFDASTLAHDVGLVLLDADAPAAPLPLAVAPPVAGQAIRLVGFGLTAPDDRTPPQKRAGLSVIDAVDDGGFSYAPAPSQTCRGDSGGPALVDDGGGVAVAGVTSAGDLACAMFAEDARVDGPSALFISGYAAAAAGFGPEVHGGCALAPSSAGGAAMWPFALAAAALSSAWRRRRGQA